MVIHLWRRYVHVWIHDTRSCRIYVSHLTPHVWHIFQSVCIQKLQLLLAKQIWRFIHSTSTKNPWRSATKDFIPLFSGKIRYKSIVYCTPFDRVLYQFRIHSSRMEYEWMPCSLLYVTWLIHTGLMTHSWLIHGSFVTHSSHSDIRGASTEIRTAIICVIWLMHICDIPHSLVRHEGFVVVWLVVFQFRVMYLCRKN